MTRRITPQTSLDNLKKEAKRWLKELRANDPDSRTRFRSVLPRTPDNPGLRDVQRALALEYGFAGWTALKQALEKQAAIQIPVEGEKLVERFLEYACPDHHVRGRPSHRMARHAAMRILEQHPDIARNSICTAVVCGETEEVERILRQRPQAAIEKSSTATPQRSSGGSNEDIFKDLGAKGWEPLLYLCFTRLTLDKANDNAVAIARLLLDHGADPNAFFMAGNSQYTPLVGVIGEGEEDRPAHPRRDELTRLLLERGANPYDMQVIYNIHFHGKVLWYLELMHEFSLKAEKGADWDDPEWHMLDMGNYGSGARWHLSIAVQQNDLELAEWCLAHGASPNAAAPRERSLPQQSLYEQALRAGHSDLVELLVLYGAERKTVAIEGKDAFVAACLRLDRDEAKRLVEAHPEYLHSREAMLAAVKRDSTDMLELLLQLGLPVDFEFDHKQRPLHLAANHDAVDVADVLIRRGAQIDPVESNWNNTPMGFAVWNDYPRMIRLLGRYTSDVWNLAFVGNTPRLRELLAAQPELAKLNSESTPLFWLPEDEKKALEIVDLFLANGANAGFRRKDDGLTAEDVARRRGLHVVANRLATAAKQTAPVEHEAPSPEVQKYELLAKDLVLAYAGDAEALQRINQSWSRNFSLEDLRAIVWRVSYKVRQASGSPNAFDAAEAQQMIAGARGFGNWEALKSAVAKGLPSPVPAYSIDTKSNTLRLRRMPADQDWDEILATMKEQRLTGLEGAGLMTDGVLKRISELDHVTSLGLGGSRQLSNDGMQVLAQMPQLEHLELSEYPGGHLNDRGLEVLRHLPNLRTFNMTWQRGISDVGAANLKFCDKLEVVNLMGTPTGDGAIDALRGKPRLRRFDTGRLVTDAGLAMLHEIPMFKTWHDHVIKGDDDEPTHLLIDGAFTDKGLANLAGLDGVFALDLFWHVSGITSDSFEVLTRMANLGSLGCDGKLSDDASMRHIAAIPRLQRLRAQGTVATDKGFIALSRSTSLERFWGRECPNLTGEGFVALSKMPALRALGVSCKKVDDKALASLPAFPALRDLTPIDVLDDGFRHVGACEKLDRLVCMYCRETTDVATQHVANLKLKSYYAGLTQITDRSLEILGRMLTLESIELYETKEITDAGLAHLVGLPRLREVHLSGLPNVTMTGTRVFPAHVLVDYNV